MSQEDLPPSEKLLLAMHNLCAVRSQQAITVEEISRAVHVVFEEAKRILGGHVESGLVERYTDEAGATKYYLTGKGIIKVCSSFT